MTLLSICTDVAEELGLTAPTAIVGNSEDTAARLLALAKRETFLLSDVHDWQALIAEQTFTTTIAEIQASSIPSDFKHFLDDTIWDRTNNRPLDLVTPSEWQKLQSDTVSSSAFHRKIRQRGGDLLIYPTPTVATDTIAYEYVINTPVESSGGTAQTTWQADSDVAKLSEALIAMGMKWRMRKVFGQSYDDDFNEYVVSVDRAIARDGGKQRLNSEGRREFLLGVNVPEGDFVSA